MKEHFLRFTASDYAYLAIGVGEGEKTKRLGTINLPQYNRKVDISSKRLAVNQSNRVNYLASIIVAELLPDPSIRKSGLTRFVYVLFHVRQEDEARMLWPNPLAF